MGSTFDYVGQTVPRIVEDALFAARANLPSDERSLGGEIVEVRNVVDDANNRLYWNLIIRDSKIERTVVVKMPAEGERPERGNTIGLRGHYDVLLNDDDTTAQFVFVAVGRDETWTVQRSKRATRRESLAKELELTGRAKPLKKPERIAIVTSRKSSATDDFLSGLGGAKRHVRCEQVPISLEGGTPSEIAQQIIEAEKLSPDLIVVARGGGKRIMLDRFDEPEVLEAIASVGSRIPVVVAVGHHRDKLLAAKLAWLSADTPSHAGALVAKEIWRHVYAKDRQPSEPAEPVEATPIPASTWRERRQPRRRNWLFVVLAVGIPTFWLGWWGRDKIAVYQLRRAEEKHQALITALANQRSAEKVTAESERGSSAKGRAARRFGGEGAPRSASDRP